MVLPSCSRAHPAVDGSIVTMTQRAWSVVVPVKQTAVAKSRLLGLQSPQRQRLALAFARDTVAAVLACPAVAQVVVVTDDEQAARWLADEGARVVPDEPRSGLNPALRHGCGVARLSMPGSGVVLLSADLPALRPAELALALADVPADRCAFVADQSGLGTTLLAARAGVDPQPAFGRRSCARHRASGALEVGRVDIPSVRRDVDTIVDLWDARRLGLGPRTRAVLAGP
jgi:2-phospho-L-lactate guanylyltransferase